MELSPKQQINELVKKSEKILLISHASLNGDAVGGMLALGQVLAREGKDVTLVASEKIDPNLAFLPGVEKLKKDISGTRDFIIQIDKSKNPIEKLSYNEEDSILNIIVTPKDGQILHSDVKLMQGEYKFDLIFVLDTADVDKIDSVYDRHTELFYETPIVNVDHHAGNEYFGTVNMVDLTATSTCEILVSIIESMGGNSFDADVATCLLTGIIADTGSFKNTNTTPKSMTISAQMLAAGARQQEIIQNLYKTRSIDTLKLWGKVLSRLEHDRENRFIYSYVTYDDFAETGAKIEDIRNVMDELLSSTPGADVVLLLAEHEPSKIAGKLKGIHGQDVLAIAEIFGGSGKAQSAGFDITNANVEEAIPDVLNKVRRFRSAQLGRDKIEHVERKEELEIPKTVEKQVQTATNHLPEPKPVETNPDFTEKKVKTSFIMPEIQMDQEQEEELDNPPFVIPAEAGIQEDDGDGSPSSQPEAGEVRPGMTEITDSKGLTRDDILAMEIEKLDHKIEQNSMPEKVEAPENAEVKKETEELFNKFISEEPINEADETVVPVVDPIVQALESLEHEETVGYIPEKIVEDQTDAMPSVSLPETKDDTLRAIGEIIRGYNPTQGLDKKENFDDKNK